MIKKEFQNLKEDHLVDDVLIPLFRKMGYKDVYKYHGQSGEKGKDIVFWEEDKLGSKINYSVVVKASKLTGRAKSSEGSANEVATQIMQSFGSPYIAPITGELSSVHRCIVVTNKTIPKEAIDAIKAILNNNSLMANQTNFWNGEKVWEMASKHLFSIPDTLDTLSQQLNSLNLDVIPEVTISERGKSLRMIPRHDALGQSPLEVSATFRFPKDDQSLAIYKNLQDFIDHGGQIKIPGEYITAFTQPQVVKQIFGVGNQKPTEIEFKSEKEEKILPFKLELLNEEGVLYCVDYLALQCVQRGRRSFTLSNEDQENIFSIWMKMHDNGLCNVNLNFDMANVSATRVKKSYDFTLALRASEKVKFTWLENSNIVLESENTLSFEPPGEGYVQLISLLSKIEEKLDQEIIIPDRDLSEDDVVSIQSLGNIVLHGQLNENWSGPFELPLEELDVEAVNAALMSLANGQQSNLLFKATGAHWKIFDAKIDLGESEHYFESVKLTNQKELEDWLIQKDYSKPVVIVIEPGDSDLLVHRYPKFLQLTSELPVQSD